MDQLIEFPLEGGGSIVVAAGEEGLPVTRGGGARGLGTDELLSRADQTLEAAIGHVQPAAEALLQKLLSLSHAPDSVEIEFGLALSASIGAVIAKGSSEANFKITLRWDRDGS
ncbi:MAG TPA: CU044_2847 family protein [Gaiellaceae bacterium]|jgi:hypothetical protein|nr:CU044_2847 family protein [Gaiellaceae bacterium]